MYYTRYSEAMSTHTHTDQSGTYTHVIDADTYTVTSEDGTYSCRITPADQERAEIVGYDMDDFQEVDDTLSLGDNEIVYNGALYSLVWE